MQEVFQSHYLTPTSEIGLDNVSKLEEYNTQLTPTNPHRVKY